MTPPAAINSNNGGPLFFFGAAAIAAAARWTGDGAVEDTNVTPALADASCPEPADTWVGSATLGTTGWRADTAVCSIGSALDIAAATAVGSSPTLAANGVAAAVADTAPAWPAGLAAAVALMGPAVMLTPCGLAAAVALMGPEASTCAATTAVPPGGLAGPSSARRRAA